MGRESETQGDGVGSLVNPEKMWLRLQVAHLLTSESPSL